MQKEKSLNLGSKMPYLGNFALEFQKNYCYIWNQRPWICLITNLIRKWKSLNLGLRMPYLDIFGLEF